MDEWVVYFSLLNLKKIVRMHCNCRYAVYPRGVSTFCKTYFDFDGGMALLYCASS